MERRAHCELRWPSWHDTGSGGFLSRPAGKSQELCPCVPGQLQSSHKDKGCWGTEEVLPVPNTEWLLRTHQGEGPTPA